MSQPFSQNKWRTQYLVLYVLGFVKPLLGILNYQTSNSLKVFYDILKKSMDFLLKKKDSSFDIMNR